jgi:predicted nucleotidyltransferase
MNDMSTPSITDHLSLDEVIELLVKSPLVDGIAEFGSNITSQADRTSDYDLLILVEELPMRVFQMVTSIQGRVADVILVEVELVDRLLTSSEPPQPRSFEALFAHKMQTARIRYDASLRLQKVQRLVTNRAWKKSTSSIHEDSDAYSVWFWLSHSLLHIERMSQSQDPNYLTAVDMMLTSGLTTAWRGYFDIRRIKWEGEKAAIRFWTEHDQDYLKAVSRCMEVKSRAESLMAYRALVELTLDPIGVPFKQGVTGVILAGENRSEDLQAVLRHWLKVLGS